jgi:two-component system chemotaxis response regulator CheB
VLLVSAHTCEGAAVTIEGLQGGAFDFICKPAGKTLAENLPYLKEQLATKLRIYRAQRSLIPHLSPLPTGPLPTAPPHSPLAPRHSTRGARHVRAIFIGVSTGGPAALAQLLPDLTARIALPTLIVQHMPPGFTKSLAESLARKCGKSVVEAEDRQTVQNSMVYLAPGGRHMLVRTNQDGSAVISLNDQPPQNNCRPSVDVLFRSAAAAYGADAIGIILTGMGNDGTNGLAALHRAGGLALAQDEASSVVWGMPGSAVAAGCVDEILPLGQIASAVAGLTKQG